MMITQHKKPNIQPLACYFIIVIVYFFILSFPLAKNSGNKISVLFDFFFIEKIEYRFLTES